MSRGASFQFQYHVLQKGTWPVSTKILTSCLANKLICILALDKPLCHFEAIQLGESICDVSRQACDEGK